MIAKRRKQTRTTSKKQEGNAVLPYPLAPETDQRIAVILCLGLYAMYVLWGLLSYGTWDEDCPTRYYNALEALSEPAHFVSAWNRPLFMVIFALPIHLGRWVIPVLMSAISVGGGYLLYAAARDLKLNHAWLAIPFLLLQPFFLGVGRDAMTEPLAATLIAAGLYYSVKERWVLFAFTGALLPLARAELAVLLPVWALVMVLHKQWKLVPLLGAGVLVWNLAGWAIKGDPLFIVNDVLLGAPDENRYGHQPFTTYFSRYFYVVGPVIFFFLFHGIVERIRRKQVHLLVLVQFLFGFLLYTIFAWKVNLGQSAGFLRNLIPLSPLAAFLALHGYNAWHDSLYGRKRMWLTVGVSAAIVILTALFYRNSLRLHHIITDFTDVFNLPIIAALMALTLALFALRKIGRTFAGRWIVLGMIGVMLMGHTLISEPPDANMNPERYMINEMVDLYQQLDLGESPRTFCSHGWFYWVTGFNRNNPPFGLLRKDSLAVAPEGSTILWEDHFSNRLASDVPLETITQNQRYVILAQYFASDFSRSAYLARVREGGKSDLTYLDEAIASAPDIPELYVRRYYLRKNAGQIQPALQDLDKATALDRSNTFVRWARAEYLKSDKRFDKALEEADKLLAETNNSAAAMMMKGSILYDSREYLKALRIFDEAKVKNANYNEAYYNAGLCHVALKDNKLACWNFTQAQKLNHPRAAQAVAQYCK